MSKLLPMEGEWFKLPKKNIYFYKMDIYKKNLKPDNTLEQIFQSERKIYKVLNDIYRNKTKTKTQNGSFVLEKGNNQVTFDFIDFNKDYVLARLGRVSDKNAIQIRNTVTYIPKGINTSTNEEIEVYTYFLLDFNTGIISFISSMYAPSILKLKNLECIYDLKNFKFNIYPIVNKEAIKDVMKKQYVTKFDVEVAVPTDEILDLEGIGLSMKEYINVKELKYQRIGVTMKTVKPTGNVFKDKKKIKHLVNKIIGSNAEVKKITVDAKNDDENIKLYNLIEHKIIEKTDFESSVKNPEKYQKEVVQQLKKAYNENEESLKKYCKITNKKVDD